MRIFDRLFRRNRSKRDDNQKGITSYQAIEDYSKAIELNPSYTSAYYNRGLAYDKLRAFKQAIEDFRKFIDIAPPQYAGHFEIVKKKVRELERKIR